MDLIQEEFFPKSQIHDFRSQRPGFTGNLKKTLTKDSPYDASGLSSSRRVNSSSQSVHEGENIANYGSQTGQLLKNRANPVASTILVQQMMNKTKGQSLVNGRIISLPNEQDSLTAQGQHHSLFHNHQNHFDQAPPQFYSTHIQDMISASQDTHPLLSTRHSHLLQPSSTQPHQTMYMNHSYGGHTTLQYQQAPHYPHNISPINPNLDNQVQPHHHQHQHHHFLRALQVQGGIPGQIINNMSTSGAYIYFQQQPAPASVSNSHQTLTILDSNGCPATIAVPTQNFIHSNRKQGKSVINEGGKSGVEKSVRKVKHKRVSNVSLDASRHSLSSGTITLLEEYRSSKDRSWTAGDVKGHIVEFCQDQNGSRFIQQRLELANDVELSLIVSEILPSVHHLQKDVFGNYVVQKLFDHGNGDMISQLKKSLEGEVISLSTQMYGCRVVQKALEKVSDADLTHILSEFHDTTLQCIHDQNGNHVIQKVIEVISNRSKTYQAEDNKKAIEFSKQLDFILLSVMQNIVSLSCHPFGCRVLQRILEHCIESQKSSTLDGIQECLHILLDDQYGNYVIQHVLQFGRKSDRDVVLGIISQNGILELSRQKFASNVIEKLLKYGNSQHRNAVVREMLKSVEDKTAVNGWCSVALLMVRDAYANYVVQTTLDVVPDGDEKTMLVNELRNNSSQLRNYTFAKHIITKLEEADGM